MPYGEKAKEVKTKNPRGKKKNLTTEVHEGQARSQMFHNQHCMACTHIPEAVTAHSIGSLPVFEGAYHKVGDLLCSFDQKLLTFANIPPVLLSSS